MSCDMKIRNYHIPEDGNTVIIKDFGRFRSNLIIVATPDVITNDYIPGDPLDIELKAELNLNMNTTGRVYYGFYFLSKIKNKCFRITEKSVARYMLLDMYYTKDFVYPPNILYSKLSLTSDTDGSVWVVVKIPDHIVELQKLQ